MRSSHRSMRCAHSVDSMDPAMDVISHPVAQPRLHAIAADEPMWYHSSSRDCLGFCDSELPVGGLTRGQHHRASGSPTPGPTPVTSTSVSVVDAPPGLSGLGLQPTHPESMSVEDPIVAAVSTSAGGQATLGTSGCATMVAFLLRQFPSRQAMVNQGINQPSCISSV